MKRDNWRGALGLKPAIFTLAHDAGVPKKLTIEFDQVNL